VLHRAAGILIAVVPVGVQNVPVAAILMPVGFLSAAAICAVDVGCLAADGPYGISAGHISACVGIPVTANINIIAGKPPTGGCVDLAFLRIRRSAGQRALPVAHIVPAICGVGMLFFIAAAASSAMNMLLLSADDTPVGMGCVFLRGTGQFGNTVGCMGMTQTADDIIAGITVGMGGRQNTSAGGLEGNGIIISCVIYIHDG